MGEMKAAMAKANILLVDDLPAKLLSYEVILKDLGHNLIMAHSAREALEVLLKNDVAVILIDVCMPDLNGFELAEMIREHPRFRDTAIIFISAINVSELDSLKGYELGGVDYVPVPVVPGVLRAKVRVFLDLYLKTRALAQLNNELERRVADRTAELEAAIARQELLAREVDHRARNALAVIQSIVSLTPPDGPDFVDAIKGRIRAMATAHNLLSETRWRGADLLRLMREELAPFDHGERVVLSGAAASIAPTVAQNLALVLHELATNAAKYGALSHPEGRLFVSWSADGEHMTIDWREEQPSEVVAPTRSGFGSRVIEASVKGQLGGEIRRDWLPSGLACKLTLPLSHFDFASATPKRIGGSFGPAEVEQGCVQGRRILVLEDEPMIAMMTSRMIADLGGEVVGPFASAEAARAGLQQAPDAAFLDVNIDGRVVYDFAAELQKRGVPFAFLTGYHAGAVDQAFPTATVLTKPVLPEDIAACLERLLPRRAATGVSA